MTECAEDCLNMAHRINKSFYLKPRNVIRQLSGIRSFSQFVLQMKIAVNLLFG